MDSFAEFLLIGLIYFAVNLLEGITGFGSIVIALPFLSILLWIRVTVPMLCVTGLLMSGFLVIRSWKSFRWKEFSFIAWFAALGMPVGMIAFGKMSPAGLGILLAVFMIGIGLHGVTGQLRNRKGPEWLSNVPCRKTPAMKILLFCGGVVHGAFGTGGPFVVIYASRALPDKGLFRATLSMLWVVLNFSRLAVWGVTGELWNLQLWRYVWGALPFLAAGVLAGDFLHRRVNGFYFRLCVYGVLFLAGWVMLGNHLKNIFS